MNSLSSFLSGTLVIYPSILNDMFAGQSNLGYRFLLFITLNISWQSLLDCKVSFEKSTDNLMGIPLQVIIYCSLAAFKILSLYLTFGILIMMYLVVGLFASILFGSLCASRICMSISFTQLGTFSFLLFFSNRFPISCSLSSPFGTPLMLNLEHLKLSQTFHTK